MTARASSDGDAVRRLVDDLAEIRLRALELLGRASALLFHSLAFRDVPDGRDHDLARLGLHRAPADLAGALDPVLAPHALVEPDPQKARGCLGSVARALRGDGRSEALGDQ